MAVYEDRIPVGSGLGRTAQYTGAAVSLALMVGMGVWGYKLVMRDVSGVPIVQAMEGDMRVAPENPGGDVALHTGLSVNAVPAQGEAGPMEDTLMLAPAGIDLAAEDIEVQPMAEAEEVIPRDPRADTADAVNAVLSALTDDPAAQDDQPAPLDQDGVLALVDQITAGETPLEELAEETAVPVISRNVPGVAISLRPFVRPASLVVPAAAPAPSVIAPAPTAPTPNTDVVLTSALPTGTNLVQLGAFPDAQTAAQEWVRLQGRFGDYLGDKERVIQEATSGGRTFYRLRAQGFPALGDAKRFCAALEAENAACIPVVVR